MRFKFECLHNGNKEIWEYDNISNDFFFNGINLLKKFKRKILTKNNFEFYTIDIILGLKCNFHCKYCKQFNYNNIVEFTPKHINSFIRLLSTIVNENQIKEIRMYGGEPLVYWKTLKKLIPEIKKVTEAKIFFPTNGSLLKEDKNSFFAKNRIKLNISYDGGFNKDYDVFEKNADILRDLAIKRNKFSFIPTISKNTKDLEEIKEIISKKINFDINKISLTKPNIIKIYDENAKLKEEDFDISFLYKFKKYILEYFKKEKIIEKILNNISSFDLLNKYKCIKSLCIDAVGNVFPDLNYTKYICGNASNLKNLKYDCFITKENLEKECFNCPHLFFCLNDSDKIYRNSKSDAFKFNCSVSKTISEWYFAEIVKALFGIEFIKFI